MRIACGANRRKRSHSRSVVSAASAEHFERRVTAPRAPSRGASGAERPARFSAARHEKCRAMARALRRSRSRRAARVARTPSRCGTTSVAACVRRSILAAAQNERRRTNWRPRRRSAAWTAPCFYIANAGFVQATEATTRLRSSREVARDGASRGPTNPALTPPPPRRRHLASKDPTSSCSDPPSRDFVASTGSWRLRRSVHLQLRHLAVPRHRQQRRPDGDRRRRLSLEAGRLSQQAPTLLRWLRVLSRVHPQSDGRGAHG
jgi:hypothetical protein